ncbi:MAG: redoxin domain-containing protein [Pirellulales bacterium]
MRIMPWIGFAVLTLAACFAAAPADAVELKENDTAPDFNLPGTDGQMHRLSELTKNHVVVLAWYPKAFTGG